MSNNQRCLISSSRLTNLDPESAIVYLRHLQCDIVSVKRFCGIDLFSAARWAMSPPRRAFYEDEKIQLELSRSVERRAIV